MKRLLVLVGALSLVVSCSRGTTTENAAASRRIVPTSKSADAVARFNSGLSLLDNLRTFEAAQQFAEALKIDPGFVLASAYHGVATPGAEGLREIERAAGGSASLSEPERTLIDGLLATRRGDNAKAIEAYTKVAALAPDDPIGHYYLGTQLLNDQKYDASVSELRKAVELNPKAGGAQNMLGYAALRQGDTAGAVTAFTSYTQILPSEPNAQDSLGEALMAEGKFSEAEAAFRKAAELSPSFWNAWEGVAYTKFYSGDAAGGREALAMAASAAPQPSNRVTINDFLAASALANGDAAGALKALDASEHLDGVQPADVAAVPIRRALVLIESGKPRDALPLLAMVTQRASNGDLPPGISRNLRRDALRVQIAAEARLKDAAAAEATAGALDREAALRPDDLTTQNAMHYGRGMLAMTKGDLATARAEFERCTRDDDMCRWQAVVAADRAGDKAGAAAARDALLKFYVRDPGHLYVRSRLAPTAGRKTTE